MKRVAVSGYFDPLHVGHIELFEQAKALGDHLIVILNSDKQAVIKKGKSFMPENERKIIIEALEIVDEVFVSIDTDRAQCESLRKLNPDVFANGGDRLKMGKGVFDIPEVAVCEECGIEIVDGLGKKIQSSSDLVKAIEGGQGNQQESIQSGSDLIEVAEEVSSENVSNS